MVNSVQDGNTPLHKAALEGRTTMVQDLLEWGASPYALTDVRITTISLVSNIANAFKCRLTVTLDVDVIRME